MVPQGLRAPWIIISMGSRTNDASFIRRCAGNKAKSVCFKASRAARHSGICCRCARRPNSEQLFPVGYENSRKRSYTTLGTNVINLHDVRQRTTREAGAELLDGRIV